VETAEVDAFEWIRSTVLHDGACLTLVAPADAGGVVRDFGGHLARGRQASLAGIGVPPIDEPVVAVRDLGPWLLVVEVNGWQGSRPEVLRRVSAGGRAVSAFWNVNLTTRFSYAVGGRVLTAFEVMSPDRRYGADPDSLEEMRAGLPWEDGEWVQLMLALASRVTGLQVEPGWLDGDFTVVPVSPVDDDPTTVIYPPTQPLTYDDRPLAWALLHAGDAARRSVAEIAARHAADEAARNGPSDFWAKAAAREASGPNPLAAAFTAVTAAQSCLQSLGEPDDEMRAEIMSALGNPDPPAGSLGLTPLAGPAPADRYLWTSAHWLACTGAVSFARGAGLDEIASAFAADAGSARDGIPALTHHRVAAFRHVGDWLAVIEWHEAPGIFHRFQRMPAGTTLVSLDWSARRRVWVRYVADGKLIDALDPQRPDQRLGEEPTFLDEYASGLPLPFPPAAYPAAQLPVMLVIAERLTGLAFAPHWLDETHVLMNILA
jgi:hypothetical protein